MPTTRKLGRGIGSPFVAAQVAVAGGQMVVQAPGGCF